MRSDSDPLADLIELQPAWVKTFDLPGGDGAYWTIFPNSDSVEIRAEVVQPTVNVWSFGVWYWPEALAVVLALLVLVTGRWWWFARKGKEPRCRKCGYELTGLKSEACPECGTALTPRNCVTGLRSRWRMALAPVALVLIGAAWWFGEGRMPRHGWVSEKVHWHRAVHRGQIFGPGLFDCSLEYHRWYLSHGGERWTRMSIDVASSAVSRTAVVQRGELPHWGYLEDLDLDSEMRAWGRFTGSESIWEIDADHCRVTKHGLSGSESFALPFCGDTDRVAYDYRNLGGECNSLDVYSHDDEWIASHAFLPDTVGDGWFIVAGDKVIHHDFKTGSVITRLDLADYFDLPEGEERHWAFYPISGEGLLAAVCDLECLLIDLETMTVLRRLDSGHANEVAIKLLTDGHDNAVIDNAMKLYFDPLCAITGDQLSLVSRDWWKREQVVAGSIAQGAWQYHLVAPSSVATRVEQITTGPGPRDVNVFYIDGGQLILAVYELPEPE